MNQTNPNFLKNESELIMLPGSGVADEAHHLAFDYSTWGLAEKTDARPLTVSPLSSTDIFKAIELINSFVDLSEHKLHAAGLVKHFQGQERQIQSLAWLRFIKKTTSNADIHGEHISATINVKEKKLIGLTRMYLQLDNETFVSHAQALTTAITFLKKAAPDLMPNETAIPQIAMKPNGSRMTFLPPLKIGHVELQWIDDHKETIVVDDKTHEVHGMKVKMFIPQTKLWAWVVVDKHGDVETFERDIFWNFDAFRRETQLWLHDQWLAAQQVSFPLLDPTIINVTNQV